MEYENGVIDEVLATEEPNHDKEQFEEMKAMLSELAGSRRHKDDAGDNNEDEEGHRALKTVYNYLHKSGVSRLLACRPGCPRCPRYCPCPILRFP